jgi:hypothetical protein
MVRAFIVVEFDRMSAHERGKLRSVTYNYYTVTEAHKTIFYAKFSQFYLTGKGGNQEST